MNAIYIYYHDLLHVMLRLLTCFYVNVYCYISATFFKKFELQHKHPRVDQDSECACMANLRRAKNLINLQSL